METREVLLRLRTESANSNKALEKNEKLLKDNRDELTRLNKEYRQSGGTLQDYGKKAAALRTNIDRLKTENTSLRNSIKAADAATKAASGSNDQLKAVIKGLRKEYNALSKDQRENSKAGQDLKKTIKDLTDELKENESAVGDNRRNVGNYRDALGGLVNNFGGFSGAILGPAGTLGAVVALSSALSDGVVEIKRIAEEFITYNGLVEQTTGLVGNQQSGLTGGIFALSKVYDQNFVDVLNNVNTVSREFNVSYGEALEQIQRGFLLGADRTGEFSDQLREYSSRLADAGINLEEFIAINVRSTREGVFSDKGLDAVAEAGTRLREFTPATQEALRGIGLVPEEIQASFESGEATIFQVTQKVSRRLQELQDDSPAVGKAIADIFGGPGEAAGLRYLRLLGDIDVELENTIDSSSGFIESQLRALEAQNNLGRASAELAQELEVFTVRSTGFFDNIKAVAIDFATNTIRAFRLFGITLKATGAGIGGLVEDAKLNFQLLVSDTQILFERLRETFFRLPLVGDENVADRIAENIASLRQSRAMLEAQALGTSFGQAFNEAYTNELLKLADQSALAQQNLQRSQAGRQEGSGFVGRQEGSGFSAGSGIQDPGVSRVDRLAEVADLEVNVERIKFERINKLASAAAKLQEKVRAQGAKVYASLVGEELSAERQKLQAVSQIATLGSQIFEEQSIAGKALSVLNASIKTYEAANVALASAPPPFNFGLMGAVITAGLLNVSKIAGFSRGGYTGPGFMNDPRAPGHKIAGVVHDGEYVVDRDTTSRAEARPHLLALSKMSRYNIGGLATMAGPSSFAGQSGFDSSGEERVIAGFARAIELAPQPVVSVEELNRVGNRSSNKVNITTI